MFTTKFFALFFDNNELLQISECDSFKVLFSAARLNARTFGEAVLIGRRSDGKVLAMFNVDSVGPSVRTLHKDWRYWSGGFRPTGFQFAPCFNYERG